MKYQFKVIEVRSVQRFYVVEADTPSEAQDKASIGDTFEEFDDEDATYDVVDRDVDEGSITEVK